MSETCPRCGRPSWRSHGGMGGGIMPDAETHCLQPSGMWCRVTAAAHRRGIDEGVRLAKEHVLASLSGDYYPRPILNWSDVDKAAAAAAAKGER